MYIRVLGRLRRFASAVIAAALVLGAMVAVSLTSGVAASGAAPTTLTLGEICECTGPQGNGYLSTPTLTAWEKWVNSHGGVAGHHVNIIIKDDAANPATSIAAAQSLVNDDHVLAIIDNTNEDTTWASFVEKSGTPIIGGQISVLSSSNADFFNPGTGFNYSTAGEVYAAKLAHPKIASMLYCAEAAVCAQAAPTLSAALAKQGIKLSYTSSIGYAAPSYAAQCLEAKAAGATVMFVADAPAIIVKAATDCASQGYHPTQIASDGTPTPQWLTVPAMNGNIDTSSEVPAAVKNPATTTFFAALDKYAPGLSSQQNFGEFALETWDDGVLFQTAATHAHFTSTPTPAELKAGLYALPKGTTLGGLAPPLTFVKGQPNSSPCFFIYKISNSKYVAVNKLKPVCLPKSDAVKF